MKNSQKKLDVINRSSQFIVNKLNIYLKKEGLEYEKLKLGTEVVLLLVSKILLLLGLGFYFNIFWEMIVMLLASYIMRFYAFGIHAKNSTVCLVLTVVMYVLPPVIFKDFYISNFTVIVTFLVFNILLYKYAPADTENHPLLGENFRKNLRLKSVINGFLVMIVSLLIQSTHFKILIIVSSLYVIIGILPITYTLLKRNYNNYKIYE